METTLEALEVFYGELTPNRAVVVARLPLSERLAGLTLGGIVRGPRCSRGHTLPATYRLVGHVSNPSKVEAGLVGNLSYVSAQALVTEPIFWTPDWPALYDVTVELRQGSTVIERTTRTMGLRPLAVVGKNLAYGGKTWVLRGVRCDRLSDETLRQCREHAAALLSPAELLDEQLLVQASEIGVLTVALLPDQSTAQERLAWLSRFPAVALAVLPPECGPFQSAAKGNILLAHYQRQGQDEPPPDDARLILGEVQDAATFADWAAALQRPVIAFRPLPEPWNASAARAQCDRLQRDLAPYGQFAGYIV